MGLLDLMQKIPATFWGVLAGSFFTILGVILTNIVNTRLQRNQLNHDRDMKKSERDLSLRKDIYLSAIEAIATGIGILTNIANTDIPFNEIAKPFIDKAPSMYKVNVIANDGTARSFFAFGEELAGSISQLSYKRLNINVKTNKVSALQKQIDETQTEQSKYLDSMNEYNISCTKENNKLDVINKNVQFTRDRISELIGEQAKLNIELFRDKMLLAHESLAEVQSITKLLIPLIKSIRVELGLTFNEAVFTELLENSQKKQSEYLGQFMGDVSKNIKLQIETAISDLSSKNEAVQESNNGTTL